MMTVFNGKEMKAFVYKDNVFSFEGCVSVQEAGEWVSPWRIKYEQAEFFPFLSDHIHPNWTAPIAAQCSGVRLCFSTDSDTILLELADPVEGLKLDLFSDGVFTEGFVLEKGADLVSFKPLKAGFKQIEIWLDHRHAFDLKSIYIREGARICKTRQTKQRWIHYGSSISHSRDASSPSATWAATVARRLELHLTSFGFGANCVMEPMMGRLIRDLPADYITLKLGINVHAGRLTRRTFAPNVIGLIQIIREKHPDTPLALISPIYSPPRETKKVTEDSLSLEEMRECHGRIVESCKKYGDRNIYYVDGLKIFGPGELKYLPDELHPNSDGQPVMAEHFIKEVFGRLP